MPCQQTAQRSTQWWQLKLFVHCECNWRFVLLIDLILLIWQFPSLKSLFSYLLICVNIYLCISVYLKIIELLKYRTLSVTNNIKLKGTISNWGVVTLILNTVKIRIRPNSKGPENLLAQSICEYSIFTFIISHKMFLVYFFLLVFLPFFLWDLLTGMKSQGSSGKWWYISLCTN